MQLKRYEKMIRRHVEAVTTADPIDSVKLIGLRYITDDIPGIQRRRLKKGFRYIDADGSRIRSTAEIERIESLKIPPAWKEVWICPFSNGHLQATGRDAKGRKQYRYHAQWRHMRNQTKFTRMIAFSEVLPQIRERVAQDLKLRGLPKEKVLATVLQFMELTQIRVGNEEYAKTNRSFGMTTLRDRHVDVSGSKIRFQFRGKSGVEHDIEISDLRLARIIKNCQDIPGQNLFQYFDEEGQRQSIDSGDVNDYLREITGQDFTAKDFRTWSGTILASLELYDIGVAESATATKKAITQAVKGVAQQLGNRPATCRKYYIHPAIFETYQMGFFHDVMTQQLEQDQTLPRGLRCEEVAVVTILKRHLVLELQDQKAS